MGGSTVSPLWGEHDRAHSECTCVDVDTLLIISCTIILMQYMYAESEE